MGGVGDEGFVINEFFQCVSVPRDQNLPTSGFKDWSSLHPTRLLEIFCFPKEGKLQFVLPNTVHRMAPPLSMGFSRQEYWSGLPFPSTGDLPDPGIKPGSPAL